jgi:hypothetical protein
MTGRGKGQQKRRGTWVTDFQVLVRFSGLLHWNKDGSAIERRAVVDPLSKRRCRSNMMAREPAEGVLDFHASFEE